MLKSRAQWLGYAHGSFDFHLSPLLAAWLRSRRALHDALAERRIAGASFGTLTGRMRGKLVGWAGTILPCCWRRSNCCASAALLNSPQAPFPTHLSYLLAGLVPGWSERSPDAPSKPTMLTERHFEKFVVKSVFGEVCSDCRRDIINEDAIEDLCFGSKRLQALCRTGNGRAWMYAAVWS